MSVVSAYAVVNGTQINLTQNSETGAWEATGTAPSTSSYNEDNGYYGVTIVATDEAGNETTIDATDSALGSSLQLVVKETTAPVITISAPTSGQLTSNNTPTVTFTVTDNDSGVDTSTVALTVDGTAVSGLTSTAIDGGYSYSYTPTVALEDGSHTIVVNASDNDGNAATEASVTFRISAAAPELAITSPADESYTNEATVSFEGTTDAASLTVQVGSGSASAVTITSGAFSGSVTLTEGTNTITFVATSESGVTTTVTRTVYLDTAAPVISSVTITPNPATVGATFTISVEITD